MSGNKCKELNCDLRGHWTETNAEGEIVVCFKVRHHGKYHVQKYTFDEVKEIFGKQAKAE